MIGRLGETLDSSLNRPAPNLAPLLLLPSYAATAACAGQRERSCVSDDGTLVIDVTVDKTCEVGYPRPT